MLREKIVLLIKKSIQEEVKLDDYSTIYYKVRIADNFYEGGIFSSNNHQPIPSYLMNYPDTLVFFKLYNEALITEERLNKIEIHFDKEMNPDATFIWDQDRYDADIQGNKKLKKAEVIMKLLSEFEIEYLSPLHHNYPAWPGGERWLQLFQTAANTQVVLTKGLSNSEDHPYEIYLETDEEISTEDFSSSWQANLVYEMGRIVPNVHNLAERMETNSFLSVQVEIDGAPPEWALDHKDGNIGLFVGLQNDLINKSVAGFTPLNIKLMRPDELLFSIQQGSEARMKLAELYKKQGLATISNIERVSVLQMV